MLAVRIHAWGPLLAGLALGCPSTAPPVGGSGDTTGATGSSSSAPPLTDSTGAPPPSAVCVDYLACVAEADPDGLPAAEAEVGEGSDCWSDPAASTECEATCIMGLDALCPEGTAGGTGEPPLTCSIEGLLPGAPSPVVAGEGSEVLPVSVGDALERNCGCHYVDPRALEPTVPAYFGGMAMATWADFHQTFMGQLVWQRVQQRAVVELNMPPPYFCDELDQGSLSNEDHALFQAWLEAGAPDAATWGG